MTVYETLGITESVTKQIIDNLFSNANLRQTHGTPVSRLG